MEIIWSKDAGDELLDIISYIKTTPTYGNVFYF